MRKKAEIKCGIYKITSPSGRVYIGQSVNIRKRFIDYKCLNCKNQPGIFNSLIKYGSKNHKFEIIEECTKEFLNEKERYWQDYYDVLKNGLNCVLTESDKLPFAISENTKLAKSQSRIKNNLENVKENIYQFDLEGNFIKLWKNRTEIKQFYSNINSNNLHSCLSDKKNGLILNNSIWSLKSSLDAEILHKVKKLLIKHSNKIINQYSLNGEFIKEWKCQKDICKVYGEVSQCVTHRCKSMYGFIWKRKNYILTNKDLKQNAITN